jgi:hypothetical protein
LGQTDPRPHAAVRKKAFSFHQPIASGTAWIEGRGQDHRLLAAGLAVQDQTIGISPGEIEVTVHVTGLIDVDGSCWLP